MKIFIIGLLIVQGLWFVVLRDHEEKIGVLFSAVKVALSIPIPGDPRTYVYICKKMPTRGQEDWVEWLEKSGECELATISAK